MDVDALLEFEAQNLSRALQVLDFAAAYSRAVQLPLLGAVATCVSLRDLLDMKARAGRQKDLLDAEALRRVHPDEGGA